MTPALRKSGSGWAAWFCFILAITRMVRLCRIPRVILAQEPRSPYENLSIMDSFYQYTWAGRFSEPMSELVKRYTASVDFDKRMWRHDIRARWRTPPCSPDRESSRRRSRRHRARHGAGVARDRSRQLRLVARPRRRAPEHRETPDRAGRRCRQAPAYRPLAQRPGGHRHSPLPARRDRRHRRPARRVPEAPARPRRTGSGHATARLHPPAGRAADHLRPSPAGLLRNDAA
jgi:hypothetical protein